MGCVAPTYAVNAYGAPYYHKVKSRLAIHRNLRVPRPIQKHPSVLSTTVKRHAVEHCRPISHPDIITMHSDRSSLTIGIHLHAGLRNIC